MGLLDNFMPGESYGIPNTDTGMQGILGGSNPLFNIGMSILANNQGHYGAFGPAVGSGAMQGIQNTQQARQMAQRKQLIDMQIAEQQRKQAADKAYSEALSNSIKPASQVPNMSFMDANNQVMQGQGLLDTNPTDVTNPQSLPQKPQSDYQWVPTAPTFDRQAMLNSVLSNPNISGEQKFATFQALQKDNSPIKVGKGETLLNPTTYQPVYTAPNEPKYQIAPNGTVIDLNNPDTTKNYAAPKFEKFDTGSAISGGYIDPVTGTFKPTLSMAKSLTPGERQQAAQNAANDAANGGITPDAIDAAAARYRLDGTIPPMGMGKAAVAIRAQILNRAAAMDAAEGVSGVDARTAQVTNKAGAGALGQLTKQRTMISAFEKNANANADMALNLSNQVDRTGIPLFNAWKQAGQKAITGNVPLSQFNAANQTFVNEYAKIMSGSMGNTPVSDAARAHANEMLSTAQTKEQYAGVVQTLKQEMGNRIQGLDDETTTLKASMAPQKKSVITTGGWSAKKVQ